MAAQAVHWHEGMFLRPHHFQAVDRYWAHSLATGSHWDSHYNWGLRAFQFDSESLANYRFVVRRLKARLRDGTLISIPEEGALAPVDLKPAFAESNSVTIMVGVPGIQLGHSNTASGPGDKHGKRFIIDEKQLEDENTGVNPQPMQLRRLNVRLLLSTQDQAGYEVLPIARLVKSAQAEGVPEVDKTYIPPVLAGEAWPILSNDILETIYDRVGKKIELLSGQVVSRGITMDSHSQGDAYLLAQLRELNAAYALLGTHFFAQGVHPLPSYLELCRLVGQLSIFGATRRPPKLPKYDHDDLGHCFYEVKRNLDALLDVVTEPEYKERPFIGAGMRMQVTLEPAWLEPAWSMYVGVQSPLPPEECNRLLTKAGSLDMKIGSSERVDDIFRMGRAGLKFSYISKPPRALPSAQGLIYFQISRDSDEWPNVQKSLTLALRLNETRIAGDIQGQQELTVRTAGTTTTLRFTLYVVPQSK